MNNKIQLNFVAYSYTFATILQALIRLSFFIFSAKILGPVEYSYWPLIQAIMSYSVIVGFGVMPAFGRELPILYGSDKLTEYDLVKNNILRYLFLYWIIFSFLGIIIIILFHTQRYFGYGILLAVFQSCIQYYIKIHRSKFNFLRLSFAILLSNIWILLSFYFLQINKTYDNLFYLFAISLVISFLVLCDIEDIKNLFYNFKKPLSWDKILNLHTIGFPLLCTGFFTTFLFSVDRWFVNYFFEKEILGQYSVAIFLIMGTRLIVDSLGQIYLPILAYGYGKNNSLAKEKKHILTFLLITTTLISLLIFFVWTIAPMIFARYIPEYKIGLDVAKWISLGIIFIPFFTICSIILQIKKFLWQLFFAQLFGILLSCLIIYIGIKYNSIVTLGKFITISYVIFSLSIILTTFLSQKNNNL